MNGVQYLTRVTLLGLASSPCVMAQQLIWQVEAARPEDGLAGACVGPDSDGDGVSELLVGYVYESCGSGFTGVVREFSTTSGQLRQWCGTSSGGEFGWPALWIDDIDGGGRADFAVGERNYHYPPIGSSVGRVQVFSGETNALIYEVIGVESGGYLGKFVVIDDVDGDGLRDLLLGHDFYGPNEEGRVLVLSAANGGQIRIHNGNDVGGYFGGRLTAIDDADGDGVGDYAIASIGKYVRIYSGASGALIRQFDADLSIQTNFGASIANCSDADGDGRCDILISKVTLGDGYVEAWSSGSGQLLWSIGGLQPLEYYGINTLEVSDQNADGVRDFLVHTPYADHENRDSGRLDLISAVTQRPLFRFYSGTTGASYWGQLLAPGADFNGDGIEDLVFGTGDGGKLSKNAGLVQIRAGNDLWLQADPPSPIAGDTVVVDLRGAPAGQLGLIALTDVDGAPLFEPLLLAPFDANGELQFCADIDGSLSGMQFTLKGYAQNKKGRGPLVDASPFVVAVQ